MTAEALPLTRPPLTPARALLYGTLAVGILDILDAFIFFGLRSNVPPIRILHSIAAGVLGRDAARAGGIPTAVLGLGLHFFIAFGVVTTYYLVSRRFPGLARKPFLYGPLYGVLVFFIMNLIVLPLSATGKAFWPPSLPPTIILINGLLIHALGVGLPSAWFASRVPPGTTLAG